MTTGFDLRGDSRLPVRLTTRPQRAEKSSVFLEWHSEQIFPAGCAVKPRISNFARTHNFGFPHDR